MKREINPDSATGHAARIRASLKAKGWNARQVSVRSEYYSLGSSVNVEVKDPSVPLDVVRAIAELAERIRRCEVTGEILGGGNRFLHVKYSREASDIIGRRYADAVQRTVNALEPGNTLLPVDGTPFLLGLPAQYQHKDSMRISIWDENRYITDCYTVDGTARIIGDQLCAKAAS